MLVPDHAPLECGFELEAWNSVLGTEYLADINQSRLCQLW